MVKLERNDSVFVLTMDDGENRMNQSWLDAMNRALDEVDAGRLDGDQLLCVLDPLGDPELEMDRAPFDRNHLGPSCDRPVKLCCFDVM